MVNKFVETSTTNRNPVVGIIFGVALFVGSFFLIFWNEENYIGELQEIEFAKSSVVSLTSSQPDPANNGKLVHFSDIATTDEILSDPLFGVTENALKINRIAEMYQWKESQHTEKTTHNNSSTTTYTYNLGWHSNLISHTQFRHPDGHENPGSMPYSSKVYTAQNITMGGFKISTDYYSQITDFNTYQLTQTNLDAADPSIKQLFKLNGYQYSTGDLNNPNVGDLKITFETITPMMMSIIGKQENNSIIPYLKDNHATAFLYPNKLSAQQILDIEESKDTTQAWIFRGLALLMMWFGLNLIFSPITMLASFVPFLGEIVGAGVSMMVSLIVIPLYIVTIAIAWFAFRPVSAVIAIAIAIGILYYGSKAIKASRSKTQESSTENKTPAQQSTGVNNVDNVSNNTPKDGNFL